MKKTKKIKLSIIEMIAYSKILTPLIYSFGNYVGQIFLENLLHITQHLMGIGSGSNILTSGEYSLIKKLKGSSNVVILDVGANTGSFINLTKNNLIKKNFELHAFEPSKYSFKILKKKFVDNDNIHLNNYALGEKKTKKRLFADYRTSGLATLVESQNNHNKKKLYQSEIVEVNTVDNYFKQNKINRVDLMKIDVEGYEYNVLLGAIKTLKAKKIKKISFEHAEIGVHRRIFFRDFYFFFKKLSYKIYRTTRSGYLHPIKQYDSKHEIFRTTNFVAIIK